MKLAAICLVFASALGLASTSSAEVPGYARKMVNTYKQYVNKNVAGLNSGVRGTVFVSELGYVECVATAARLRYTAAEAKDECSGDGLQWWMSKVIAELKEASLTPSMYVVSTKVIHRASEAMLTKMTKDAAQDQDGFNRYAAPIIKRAYFQWMKELGAN